MKWWKRAKNWLRNKYFFRGKKRDGCTKKIDCEEEDAIRDAVTLSLAGLEITLSREMNIDIPHEVTIVVPRAEIRKKCPTQDCPDCQLEILLNSITIAHSPRPIEQEGQEGKMDCGKKPFWTIEYQDEE